MEKLVIAMMSMSLLETEKNEVIPRRKMNIYSDTKVERPIGNS